MRGSSPATDPAGGGAELRHQSPANRNSQRSEAQQLRPEILREILAHREQLQAAAHSFGADHRQRHRERLRRVRSDARGGSLREILAEILERQRLRNAHKVS